MTSIPQNRDHQSASICFYVTSDFADFFIKTGLEGMDDCLLTDPAMPCLLRPEGHPGSELAKVYGNQGKRCGSTLYELCTAPWHRSCTLVIIFVAYKKGV